MYQPEVIAQIIEANPIEEIIGEYITLRRVGKNLRANCPFHQDTVPSFYVSPDKGLYHCFGCNRSGNVIKFLMEYNNMSFSDALNMLANRAGIKLEKKGEENEELYNANEFAAKIYHNLIFTNEGKPGYDWFLSRKIKKETIEKFMLGYAPKNSVLYKEIIRNNMDVNIFQKLGLIKDGEDYFSGKVIFPIRNAMGKVVGLGARVLDDSLPKYINSVESPIFKKGNLLYGLYESREYIRDECILVEGYMDLLSVYQSGTKNVVASLGTALTANQAKMLKLYTKSVTIVYDGDEAGRKATDRAINVMLSVFSDINVILLENGDDPDSFVRKNGALDLSKKESFLSFKLDKCKNYVEKQRMIEDLRETFNNINDRSRKELLADEFAKRLGINKEFLLVSKDIKKEEKRNVNKIGIETLEAKIFGLSTKYEKIKEILLKENYSFITPELKNAFEEFIRNGKIATIFTQLTENLQTIIAETSFSEIVDCEKFVHDCLKRIERMKFENRIKNLKEKIGRDEATEEEIKEYCVLQKKLNRGR